MPRVTTWNVNGIRAAIRKGIDSFVEELDPDILLFQEIRAEPGQLPKKWAQPKGWHVHWHPAKSKKGYAGVATWSKEPIKVVGTGMGGDDPEGRILVVRSAGLTTVNVYQPSGSSGEHRQKAKEEWMAQFLPWAAELAASPEATVMGGDFNIAHTEMDIHNPSGNRRNSGFLPHEREWFGQLLQSGWTDLLRVHLGEMKGPYSWWSNRGRARDLDRGWRIDYMLGNAAASKRLVGAHILREGGMKISDHAPVTVDFC